MRINLVCPKCHQDHPCKCERKQKQQDYWINKRVEEMEEKAGAIRLPKYDMDGCTFEEPTGWQTNERDDAYVYSLSIRLQSLMGI